MPLKVATISDALVKVSVSLPSERMEIVAFAKFVEVSVPNTSPFVSVAVDTSAA